MASSQRESDSLSLLVEHSLETIVETFRRYETSEVSVAFNGGKDSVVLLDLIQKALERLNSENGKERTMNDILTIYFEVDNSFLEITEFVTECVSRLSLHMVVYRDFKSGLETVAREFPHVKAIFMGTRRTDPHGDLEYLEVFEMTSPGWPQFMRVSPILEWSYHDIWHYIRKHNVPYCKLYDRGYTSIGQTTNTQPNLDLRVQDRSGNISYKAPELLSDGALERRGRH